MSSVSIKFVRVHKGAQRGGRVHASSRGLTCTRILLDVFIRVLAGFLEHMRSTALFLFESVHSCACSDRVVQSGPRGFCRAGKAVARLILVRLGSFMRAYASPCSFRFPGITRARIDVDGFIWVRDGSRGRAKGSPSSFGLARIRVGVSRGRCVHLDSLGFIRARLEDAEIIRVPLGSLGRG